jgi:hypothetical protein
MKTKYVVIKKTDGYKPIIVYSSYFKFLCECLVSYYETKAKHNQYEYKVLSVEKFLNGEY